MKIRETFVSNSSSSSFAIALGDITALQLKMIEAHVDIAEAMGECVTEPWYIRVEGGKVVGSATMDNFDMQNFLVNIAGISEDKIEWGE